MLSDIKSNEKYTLLLENNWGLIITRKVKINEISFQEYAQYKNALKLVYTEKGKRKKSGVMFTDNKVAIIENWHDIKHCFNSSENVNVTCFDNENFETILKNYDPILKYNC